MYVRIRRRWGQEAEVEASGMGGLILVVEGGAEQTDTGVIDAAWREVVNGYERALAITGLPDLERARLMRCHRSAARKAGLPPVRPARAQRPEDPA